MWPISIPLDNYWIRRFLIHSRRPVKPSVLLLLALFSAFCLYSQPNSPTNREYRSNIIEITRDAMQLLEGEIIKEPDRFNNFINVCQWYQQGRLD